MLRSAELLLLVAAAALFCEAATQTTGCGRSKIGLSRIVGGQTATKGQYPWQVDILRTRASSNDYTHLCGGTLISNQFVLTAAHCFYGKTSDPWKYMIVLGEYDELVQEGTEVKIKVNASQIIIHRGYDEAQMVNDIALLRLSQLINLASYPYINTACLPEANENFLNNTRCVVTGWGDTKGFQKRTILQVVNAPLVSSATCRAYFAGATNAIPNFPNITDNVHICSVDRRGGACFGDSGGPLACPRFDGSYAVVGIVSFGDPSCKRHPSVYTNVTNYRRWIQLYTGL